MSTPKTRPTSASVDDYLARIEDPIRRQDCEQVTNIMRRVTKCEPVMWGTGIVGFDSYIYQYKSGEALDWPVTGFASRKNDLTLYLMGGFSGYEELLERLGKHKTSKACLYLKRLSDVDLKVLEKLIVGSVKQVKAMDKAKQKPAKK